MSTTPLTSDQLATAAGGFMGKLDDIHQVLKDLLLDSEQEPDFDVTFSAGAVALAASAVTIVQLPRTIRHAEIELSVANLTPANGFVALLAGNWPLAQAQQLVNASGNVNLGTAQAIAVSNSGNVTARDYLDGSGYLTFLFQVTAATTIYANARVRSLDASQMRPQRT